MKTTHMLALATLASGLLFAPFASSAGDGSKQRVNFSKCGIPIPAGAPPDTVFAVAGPVSGDVTGQLLVLGQPGAFEMVGNRIYLEADYHVTATDGSGRSFTARVGGLWNTDSVGRAVLYGFVSDGWLRGAQVVDEFAKTGQPGCVAGTLTLTPRWVPGDND